MTVRTDGPVTTVVLDRPDAGNPLDDQVIGTLLTVLDEVDKHNRAIVVLRAVGPTFCQGMPLDVPPTEWADQPLPPPWRLFQRIHNSSALVVASIDGSVRGGGVGLSAACDLVIAGPSATWRLTEALLGFVPAMVLPFLAERIGVARAVSWTLTARTIDADLACRTGLADLLATDPQESLHGLLRDLRRLPAGTVSALKSFRQCAFRIPDEIGAAAGAVLAERLAAPETQHRLRALREAGLLSGRS
ncbi:hypothetical protein D5S18_26430 [Nocardia panacis]|uniref:Enoyl-CoA hydratase/isomerase family protein n=1 Tax=Nocardia panacis TaxID=2340916 RepID=A0A3A4K0G2_9NOCA|nr:enoyl-CoA hydratase-related protein [Nocardia panacis]RJO70743.1 hypothetical protein D5S18_26430 [Nocardia panacis]